MAEEQPSDPRTDAELVAAARAGDPSAFDVLYTRYRDWVLRLAHRWTSDADGALDVLQDAFLYVLRRLPELELRAKFTTFLYPVVRHLALASLRHRSRVEEQDLEPEAETAQHDPREDLAHVLGALPTGQREVVLMRYVDDLPLADIAERLGIPLGTVKSRLHQALQVLRSDPRTRAYFQVGR